MFFQMRFAAPVLLACTTGVFAADVRTTYSPSQSAPSSLMPEMVPLESAPLEVSLSRPRGVNWEGFFIGAQMGGGVGDSGWGSVTGAQALRNQLPGSAEIRGISFGVQGGYNWQFGPMVIGSETQMRTGSMLAHVKTSQSDATTGYGQVGYAESSLLLNTNIRFGYAAGQNLYLLKAGATATNMKFVNDSASFGTTLARKNETLYGPMVGVGLEHDLGSGFSARVQYEYTKFLKETYNFTDGTAQVTRVPLSQDLHMVTAGIDYRFGAVGDQTSVASPTINQDLSGEIGLRGTYAMNDYSKEFNNPTLKSQKDALLEWKDQKLGGAELFAFIEHDTGLFVKGVVGASRQMSDATFRNQDLPPQWAPYSDIRSAQKDGRRVNVSADLGFQLWSTKNYKVGVFAGGGIIHDRLNAYGCQQVATSTDCAPAVASNHIYVTDDQSWHVARLGMRGEATLFDRIRVTGDMAWLPRFNFTSHDNHWLNDAPWDVLRSKGTGNNGLQTELVISYDVTPSMSAGVGGRYTQMTLRKAESALPIGVAPTRVEYSDMSGFLQLSYRFKSDLAR